MQRLIFVSIGIVLLLGCGTRSGPNGSLSGNITYNGNPVNGAILHLHPSSSEGAIVNVGVAQDGSFQASDIPPGEYKIVVEGSKPPPNSMKMPAVPKGMDQAKAEDMKKKYQQVRGGEIPTIAFPAKYKSRDSTDLTCTITQGKKESLDLKLKD